MDNNDPIQQSNLVSDDAAAAMAEPATAVVEPQTIQPDPAAPQMDATEPAPVIDPVMPPADATAPPASTAAPASHDELDAIKKNALDELQPLIQHVEQSPEERFETVMMMIRSNDDASLVGQAYEAAQGIADEKTKANALLNIVSEIEYLKSKSAS